MLWMHVLNQLTTEREICEKFVYRTREDNFSEDKEHLVLVLMS